MEGHNWIRLMDYVKEVPDPRKARGKRYDWHFLLTVVCAALSSGQKTVWAIVQWAIEHAGEIIAALQPERRRMPSPATFYRALRQVDIAALEQCVAAYAGAVDAVEPTSGRVELGDGTVVHGQALDGKAVRGAQAHGASVHLLSLVRHGSGITLTQQPVDGKTNEIGVAPQLLAGRDLAGTVTTMDALLTQRGLAQQILDQHGDYLMVVKHNQPHVWAAIDQLFHALPVPQDPAELSYTYTQTEHGRLETRTMLCRIAPKDNPHWPGLGQVIQRSCRRVILRTGEIQEETTYGLTSLKSEQAGPEQVELVWRGHWTIENRVHYVRDETLGEDRCQVHTGHAPQALAALRNSILTTLRYRGWHNIAEAMRHFSASVQRALTLIGAVAT